MDTCLSSAFFFANFSADKNLTRKSYGLTNARDAGFKEDWLQRAIAENCELVLAPCRAAGLIDKDEQWACWGREVHVGPAWKIDLLLISESGRVAIVETKLASNPEARREVVVQVLEYAINLPSSPLTELPPIPNGDVVHPRPHDIENSLREGDYLLIIAGDELDPRAIKLSEVVLGKHLVQPWDLALVELAVFQSQTESGQQEHLLVPHLRGVLAADRRQVVTVKVEGSGPRVTVENFAPAVIGRTSKWTEEQFFAAVEQAPADLRDFTGKLQVLCKDYPELAFEFGASKQGSVLLKKEGASVLTFFLGDGGSLSFRTKNDRGEDNFVKAFGEQWGLHYRRGLEKLVNRPMEGGIWFGFPFQADKAEDFLLLLREALNGSRSGSGPSQAAAA